MKRILVFLLTFYFLGLSNLKADEGMWLLHVLNKNYKEMKKQGLKLKAKDIYSLNHSSIKDAIVNFGGFCTGEIVSDQGLVFTNHHCGYDAIAELSTERKNYLKQGFWAYNQKEELPAEGLYVKFLIKMGKIPKKIQAQLKTNNLSKREEILKKISEELQEKEGENKKYEIEIKAFFEGNEYYFFVYQTFRDIRLVGAPPSSVGKFGGDTDNWMWPRHTGDFSIFRIYADKHGNPANYHPTNVPFRPKHFLPISLKGIKPEDFSFIMGYPGSTDRYLSSWGVENLLSNEYPSWVEASKASLEVLKKYMDTSPKVKLNYASDYARIANYWKNRKGMIESMMKNDSIGKKKKIESQFEKWFNKRKKRKKLYAGVFPTFEQYYKENKELEKSKMYIIFLLRNKSFSFLRDLITISHSKEKNIAPKIEKVMNDYFSKSNPEVEKALLAAQLKLYDLRVKEEFKSDYFKELKNQFAGNFKEIANELFSKSVFNSKETLLQFFKNSINKDPLIALYDSIRIKLRENIKNELEEKKEKAAQLFVFGMQEMQSRKKSFYPDANSSMRLTYGKVKPLDKNLKNEAKGGNYYTTLEGLLAKYKPLDEEFDLPKDFINSCLKKDYGNYANEHGELSVNFLSNNDITGGNSGSPIMNAKGELIGIAFDGNWEAMSGDIEFEKNLQRTISVDVRFILFIIDKFAGAKNILNELRIVY